MIGGMHRSSVRIAMSFAFWMASCLMNPPAAQDTPPSRGPIAPPRRDVPGRRFELSGGRLYVPAFFSDPGDRPVQAVVFFHGAAWCAEQCFYNARKNAVLITVNVPGYAFAERFARPSVFRDLLSETSAVLAENSLASQPVAKVSLASFSGGYGAVHAILQQAEFVPLISDVVLADSLYGAIDPETGRLAEDAVAPFLEFAGRAARGETTFLFSHLYPPVAEHRGNKTTLAANALIDGVGAQRQETSEITSRGVRVAYRADLGNFHVLGYDGMTTQDHFEHFYGIGDRLRQTSLEGAAESGLLPGFDEAPFGEQVLWTTIEPGVRLHINAPGPGRFDPDRPTRLILYALPNGNTIEQTVGKKLAEGVDWHFGIQHIGAQTRQLREVVTDENIVVAYLEADGLSWPAWRRDEGDKPERVREIVDAVVRRLPSPDRVALSLSGHSAGGSFVFAYINAVDRIPDNVRCIVFLDSNYGYSEEAGHAEKLAAWLRGDSSHSLVVIAYDDREIMLNGKKVIGPTGGTYRRTLEMIERLGRDIPLGKTVNGDLVRHRDAGNQVEIIVHTNPENRILHTVLVGDMNGFIHAETFGTKYEGVAATFGGPVAYERWISPE